MVEDSELLGFADDNNIVDWNSACDLICDLYPSDGAGMTYIDVQYMIAHPESYNPLLYKIILGFATEHDAEFQTLQGFYFFSA